MDHCKSSFYSTVAANKNRLYTKAHEWVAPCDGNSLFAVGITDLAQKSLGDIVFVDFSSFAPGDSIRSNDVLAVVESVKGASDVFCPIGGEFHSFNEHLREKPNTINRAPYDEGKKPFTSRMDLQVKNRSSPRKT